MKTRVITAIVLLLIFLPILVIGGLPLTLLMGLLTLVGVYEFFSMKGMSIVSLEGVLTSLAALCITFSAYTGGVVEGRKIVYGYFICVMILCFATIFMKERLSFETVGFLGLIALYVGAGCRGMIVGRNHGLYTIALILVSIWGTDTGAYFTGLYFGKTKIAPTVSPKKTLEGSIGGTIIALVLASVIFGLQNPLSFPWYGNLLVVVVLSICGQLGDLVESSYKRHFGVKDSGSIFPGHGGVLDRFDSTFFVLFIFQIIVAITGR